MKILYKPTQIVSAVDLLLIQGGMGASLIVLYNMCCCVDGWTSDASYTTSIHG